MKGTKLHITRLLSLILALIALLTVTTSCSSSADKYHEKEVNDTMHELYKKGSDGLWYRR